MDAIVSTPAIGEFRGLRLAAPASAHWVVAVAARHEAVGSEQDSFSHPDLGPRSTQFVAGHAVGSR